jgi:hypothetical protein
MTRNCLDASTAVSSRSVLTTLQLIDSAQNGTTTTISALVALLSKRLKANSLRFRSGSFVGSDLSGAAGELSVTVVTDDETVGVVTIKWIDFGNRAASRDLSFMVDSRPLLAA